MEFEIIAKTFQGLEGVLAEELRNLGANNVEEGRRMVSFTGDNAMLYKANFCCRTALRILKPIYKFIADDADTLYEAVKKFEWDTVLNVNQTFAIDTTVYSEEFSHSRFVTYRVKDAIADFFTDKYERRPSISISAPDVQFNVHIAGKEVTLSLDSTGEPLYKRGYRVAQTEAPINEVLAAGILKLAGWDGQCNLVDPMCGSGTFLIEAALMAMNINPGVFRKGFAFEKWADFDAELFESIANDDSGERDFNFKIYGSDIAPKAVEIAKRNIMSAGVARYVELECKSIQSIETAPEGEGLVVTNPPYGERIAVEDMEGLYRSIGERLKRVFKGYKAWIIGPTNELFDFVGLKPSVKMPILNGELECELREYVMFAGRYDDLRAEGGSIKNTEFESRRSDDKPYRKHKFEETFKGDRRHDRDDKRGFKKDDDRRDGKRSFKKDDRRDDKRSFKKDDDRQPRHFRTYGEDSQEFEENESRGFERREKRDDYRKDNHRSSDHRGGDRDDKRRHNRFEDDPKQRRADYDKNQHRERSRRFDRDFDDDDETKERKFVHNENFSKRVVKFRKPQLSKDNEVISNNLRRRGWRKKTDDAGSNNTPEGGEE